MNTFRAAYDILKDPNGDPAKYRAALKQYGATPATYPPGLIHGHNHMMGLLQEFDKVLQLRKDVSDATKREFHNFVLSQESSTFVPKKAKKP